MTTTQDELILNQIQELGLDAQTKYALALDLMKQIQPQMPIQGHAYFMARRQTKRLTVEAKKQLLLELIVSPDIDIELPTAELPTTGEPLEELKPRVQPMPIADTTEAISS